MSQTNSIRDASFPTSSNERHFGIGMIGCGGFGVFALHQFAQVPGVRVVGLSDINKDAATAACLQFGLPHPVEVEELLRLPGVGLVYIATPPFLHYPQALQALHAGKHVLIEKPTCLTLEQFDELMNLAHTRGLLLATDLMQRYNPMFDAILGLLQRKPLGELLHAYFENYASDENLPAQHWFWDREKSGGIFIEHGVHFFELFAGWLGAGTVEAAQASTRHDSSLEDQVQCTVRYRDDILVNFYHGFTQTGRMDRQELRLVFERGDVRLDEWIPTRSTVRAVLNEDDARELFELFPGAQLDILASYEEENRLCMGRHQRLNVHQMIIMKYGYGESKMHRYGEIVRSLFIDQRAWIGDRRHVRRLTEEDARNALAMAVEADRLAHSRE